jgi:hypothetical protein
MEGDLVLIHYNIDRQDRSHMVRDDVREIYELASRMLQLCSHAETPPSFNLAQIQTTKEKETRSRSAECQIIPRSRKWSQQLMDQILCSRPYFVNFCNLACPEKLKKVAKCPGKICKLSSLGLGLCEAAHSCGALVTCPRGGHPIEHLVVQMFPFKFMYCKAQGHEGTVGNYVRYGQGMVRGFVDYVPLRFLLLSLLLLRLELQLV